MVKIQTLIVCDKCENPFKDTDIVYGYADYDASSLVYNEKNYIEYFFDKECIDEIKYKCKKEIKNRLISESVIDNSDEIIFYVPYISKNIKFIKLDFLEFEATYFLLQIKNKYQLIKVIPISEEVICINEAVDLIFSDFEEGKLIDLRRKFKEKADLMRCSSDIASCAIDAIDCKTANSIKTTYIN